VFILINPRAGKIAGGCKMAYFLSDSMVKNKDMALKPLNTALHPCVQEYKSDILHKTFTVAMEQAYIPCTSGKKNLL